VTDFSREDATPHHNWARIRKILARVLDNSPTEQAQILKEECGADEEMKRQVESLLEAARGSAFFDQPATVPNLDREKPVVRAESALEGRTISHYRIDAKIGEGGMGAVYKATDVNLGRVVAFKVISSSEIDNEDRRRFAREAKAASLLNHPNIITIYEYNSAGGIDFLAMEYVEGATLARVLADRSAALRQILEYSVQVASALAKAHAAGIVHRDLKPGNIMIAADGVAKVLDFGLARVITRELQEVTALTRPHTILGTPGYMSPEQALGEAVDHRSDIFAFGAILYEMVCGERAFRGDDMPSTLRQVIYKEPVPVTQINPATPKPVSDLITACLRKDKGDRLPSMEEAIPILAEAARSVAAPTVEAVGQPHPVDRRLGARSRWGIGIATGAAATALLFTPQIRQRISFGGSAADGVWKSAPDWRAEGQALLTRHDRKGNLDRAQQCFQQAIQLNTKDAAAYAGLAEAYLMRMVAANMDAQWPKLALEAATRAIEINPYLATGHATAGYAVVSLSGERWEEGMGRIERALLLDPRSALAHSYRGLAFEKRKQSARAEESFRMAASVAPDDWRYHQRLGVFLFRAGRVTEAVGPFETSVRLSPGNAEAASNLGAALHATGRYEEAAASYQRSLEAGPSARGFSNLGTLLYFLGRYSESAEAFERAIRMDAASYLRWGNLGDAYRWIPGAQQKSRDAYQQAIRLVREDLAGKPEEPNLQSSLGIYLARSGDKPGALAQLTAIRHSDALKPSVLFKLGLIHELCGDRTNALDRIEQALRGGYSAKDVQSEPDFHSLRKDARYQRILSNLPQQQ